MTREEPVPARGEGGVRRHGHGDGEAGGGHEDARVGAGVGAVRPADPGGSRGRGSRVGRRQAHHVHGVERVRRLAEPVAQQRALVCNTAI